MSQLHKDLIENHLQGIDTVVLDYIRLQERPVSAIQIKEDLDLLLNPYPINNKTQGPKGWLYGIIIRRLENLGRVEQYKEGNRAYVRLVKHLHIKDPRAKTARG